MRALLLLLSLLTTLWAGEQKTIAIFTCKAYGLEWDLNSIKSALPGGEEAVVYMSQELANLGYKVTVFANPPKDSSSRAKEANPRFADADENDGTRFDIAISWRMPGEGTALKKRAKKVYLWPHDIFVGNSLTKEQIDSFDDVLWLSEWQRDQWCEANPALKKFTKIFGNGVNPKQFSKVEKRKNPHACIYGSNYARGLSLLLDIWPEVKKEFPKATLDIYYGWQHWGLMTPEKEARLREQVIALNHLDVVDHGGVGHEELNRAYAQASVWAYPCTMSETFCITAIRAQLSGAIPAIIEGSALTETVRHGYKCSCQEEFLQTLFKALRAAEKISVKERKKMGDFVREEFTWAIVANKWRDLFETEIPVCVREVTLLEEALKKDPGCPTCTFLLAESYRELGLQEKALEHYQKLLTLATDEEMKYFSHLHYSYLLSELHYAQEKILEGYLLTHKLKPDFAEPIYYLAILYNQRREHKLAYDLLKSYVAFKEDPTPDWIKEYGLQMQLVISSYYVGEYKESFDTANGLLEQRKLPESWREQTLTNRKFSEEKLNALRNQKVLLAILARDKDHVLPTFLKCIENLDYDKKLLVVYINTNNNSDRTAEILGEWKEKNQESYACIEFVNHELDLDDSLPHAWTPNRTKKLGAIRKESMQKAKEYGCGYYFVVDCDNFVAPCTLKELISHNKPIIAPMLLSFPEAGDGYCNFFCDINEKGYYKEHPNYFKILRRQMVGAFKVPVVHCTYLVKSEYIDSLSYADDTDRHEFIIFSESARNHGVDQYICNEKEFGVFLNFFGDPKAWTLEKEKVAFRHFLEVQRGVTELLR